MIVIFSGYNQRAVIAFLRCLTKNHIEEYVIVAASNQDTILKTKYKDKIFMGCALRENTTVKQTLGIVILRKTL